MQLVGIVRAQIILQAKSGNRIHPWFVGAFAVVGMACLVDGDQDFLQQVIYLVGEAKAFRQEWPEEA